MTDARRLEIVPETEMSSRVDSAIRQLLCACFPADVDTFSQTRAWHGSAPEFTVIHRRQEVVLAHIGIVIRDIRIGSDIIRVAGVQNLAVTPPLRGAGLSRELMSLALSEARRRDILFGLLFCVPELEHHYRTMEWQKTPADVTMINAAGRRIPLSEKNIAMQIELSDASFPVGAIDLRGADW